MDRMTHLVIQLEALHKSMRGFGGGDSCDLVDEKVFQGASTTKGDACRITIRAKYLIAVLDCEIAPSPTCCDEAAQQYCDDWEGCPA